MNPIITCLAQLTNRAVLISLQIPLVADLPVGLNLQDHIYPGGIHFTIDKPVSLAQERIFTPKNLLDYFTKGIGELLQNQK